MPADTRKLLTKGFLLPEPNGMKCSTCGLPVGLLLNRKPGLPKKGEKIPGLMWGTDVSVVCMCCSYPHCTHKKVIPIDEKPSAPVELEDWR